MLAHPWTADVACDAICVVGRGEVEHQDQMRVVDPQNAGRDRASRARRQVETDLSFDNRMRAVEQVYDELMAARRRSPDTSSVAMRA